MLYTHRLAQSDSRPTCCDTSKENSPKNVYMGRSVLEKDNNLSAINVKEMLARPAEVMAESARISSPATRLREKGAGAPVCSPGEGWWCGGVC